VPQGKRKRAVHEKRKERQKKLKDMTEIGLKTWELWSTEQLNHEIQPNSAGKMNDADDKRCFFTT